MTIGRAAIGRAAIGNSVEPGNFPSSLPMTLTGTVAVVASSLPMTLTTSTEVSASSIPMMLESPDSTHYTASTAEWSAVVKLNHVDITDQLSGAIEIDAEEDASTIATLTIIPDAGSVDPGDYERKPLAVWFVGKSSGVESYRVRRFTGITTAAVYDPDDGTMSITATTDLQGRLENLDREVIADIVGGTWSEHVFDDTADGWQYALDRLSTIASSVYVDAYGQIKVTQWAAGSADVTFNDSSRFADTLTLDRVSRRDLLTRVRINMDFRFTRLRHREIGVSFVNSLGFCGYLNGAGSLPTKDTIMSAADSNEWVRVSAISFTDLPVAGEYCTPLRGWVGDEQKAFCLSASWRAARRWAQTVTEVYTLDVIATDLEESIGVQQIAYDYGIEAVYDSTDFEQIREYSSSPTGSELSAATNDYQLEATSAERTGRTAMETAQEVALSYGKSQILDRARQNRIRFEPVYDPSITLSNTVRVNTPHLVATGKVAAVSETLDPAGGELSMRLTLALSRHGGSGLASDDTIAAADQPTQPTEENTGRVYYLQHRSGGTTTAPADNESWDGWITNAYGAARTDPDNLYRERFVIRMPAIEDAARQATELQQAATYEVAVPQNELTMSN